MKICELKKLFNSGDRVLLAVSGGLDSMCLLHAFNSIKEDLMIDIAAVTVNHNLRGEEGCKDVRLVERFCKENGIRFLCCSVNADCKLQTCGHNIEAEARKLRYEALTRAKDTLACNKVVTAHHADDNAETVLFNIFRGAGLKGAGGIPKMRGDIIRPLLGVKREELLFYAAKYNIEYRDDLSNFDIAYTRNFLRAEIIPRLKERFPAVVDNINSFAERAVEDETFIESQVRGIEKKDGIVRVPLEYYTSVSMGARATRRALNLLGLHSDISAKNYRDAGLLAENVKGAATLFRNNIIAKRSYDCLIFSEREAGAVTDYEIPYGGNPVMTPAVILRIEARTVLTDGEFACALKNRAPDELFFDAEKIPPDAVWRNRRAGDVFCKFGGGTKKLNDYMTDIKMEDGIRDTVPLLASGNDILLIAGYKISARLKMDGKKYFSVRPYTEDTQRL